MELPSGSELFLGILLGAIGTGYFLYGKKQARAVHLLAGLALMAGPIFLPASGGWLVLYGAIVALPFVASRWWGL